MIPDKFRKREIMFGDRLSGINTLIIIPVSPIFNEFEKYAKNKYMGWWKTFRIGKNTAVVKSPVSTHSSDAAYYAPNVDNTIFIGYCGAINKAKPGDIVLPTRVVNKTETIHINQVKDLLESRIYQVKSFNEQETPSFIGSLKERNIDFIDMESYSVFLVSKDKSRNLKAYFVVTDNLISRPFYDITSNEMKKISDSSKTLVERVMSEIE